MRTIGTIDLLNETGYGKLRKLEHTVTDKLMTFSDMAALETYQAEKPGAYVRSFDVRNGVIKAQMWLVEEVGKDAKV